MNMLGIAERPKQRRSKAEDRIDARLPAETKRVIEHAASLIGVTVSDFVINQAYNAAQTVIKDRERWVLDRAQSNAFVETLLNPPEPSEGLKQAAARFKAQEGLDPR